MKKLEEIKKRLPPGIDVRISSKNILTFRARFRRKGYPDQVKTFPDIKLAKTWLDEQNRNALMGIHLPHIKTRCYQLNDAINRYIKEELPRKPKNASNVLHHLKWFLKELGDYALTAIRPSMITEVKHKLEQEITVNNKKRSPTTVRRYLTSLSHLFTVAVRDWEWIHENPVLKVSKPKSNPGRQRYLTDDERKRLLHEAKNSQCPILYPVVVLALSTGMRRGEITNLRWGDIDLFKNQIILETTKNGEPNIIPLVGSAFKEIFKLEASNTKKSELVFPSPNNSNKPYDFQSAWNTALKRAKIHNFTFHDLRHSTASYQAANGRSLFEIGQLLGHKSTQTTKRYAHLTNKHTKQMVEELDKKLFGEQNYVP